MTGQKADLGHYEMQSTIMPDKTESDAKTQRLRLTCLTLDGWKSIKALNEFPLTDINVLIGTNGAGKSNLISFFRMLSWLSDENLQTYIARYGGANALLHCGAASTPQLSAAMAFESEKGKTEYDFRLFHAASDTLIFADEQFCFTPAGKHGHKFQSLGSGHREALVVAQKDASGTRRFLTNALKSCIVYQFHNTSETARMRQRWSVDDNAFLKEDAANIAPFLMRLADEYPKHYRLIVETIQQAVPFFLNFTFNSTGNTIMLQWRERTGDTVYSAYQASDGMLRVIALTALLLQPAEKLPSLLVLDEPELGLHPYAIDVIAGLVRSASQNSQVIVATQSTTFLDNFDPSEIVVVDRDDHGSSQFHRLKSEELQEWLSEYSLSELWEKNVIGGRPK